MKVGIRTYLIAIVGTLSTVPMLVLGTVTARRASASELDRADLECSARARAVSRELDQFMAEQISSVELLAGHVEAAGGLDSPRLPVLLATHRKHSAQIGFAYLANRAGISLVTDPPRTSDGVSNAGVDYSDRDYYHELIEHGRTTISRVQLGRRSKVPNIQVAAPIRNPSGELVGFAEESIDLKGMSESIASAVAGTNDSRVVVTDSSGRVLADSSGRFQVLSDVSALPLFATSVEGLRSTTDDQGVRTRAAVAKTSHVAWTITAIREQSSVDALADAARRDAIVIMLITLFAALVIVVVGVVWLSRPIRRLARATAAIGRGDFSIAVPTRRRFEPHEVDELIGAVGEMATRVQHHHVETSTLISKLESVNDELKTMVVGIEHAGNAIEVADAQGRLVYVNRAWEQLTRYPAKQVLGRAFVELFSTDRSSAMTVWDRLVTGRPWHGIAVSRCSDGKLVEIEVDAVPVMRSDGTISHVVATRIDLTEKRRAEELLRMNDRLAAVGTLAAGVAHEINNPLTYVGANLHYLREQFERLRPTMPAQVADLELAFDDATVGVERVTEIVRDLKQLSRTDARTSNVDINQLLESSVRMANLEIKHRATVECDYGDVPSVVANEARLAQVFLNLLINAAQACDVGKKATNVIRIATTVSNDGAETIIEISDTGIGMAPEVQQHIFDPFFTTKPVGVGTGLGLSICHGIVSQHGGSIAVARSSAEGSTFRVTLPVARSQPSTARVTKLATTTTKLRILVVDDDRTLASAVERMLRDHEATSVTSATAALALIDSGSFDVVLSDIMMPELNGLEFYERASSAHPEYSNLFVFMTGGIIHQELASNIDALHAPVLYKPFERDELLEVIARFVGDRAPSTIPRRVAGSLRR